MPIHPAVDAEIFAELQELLGPQSMREVVGMFTGDAPGRVRAAIEAARRGDLPGVARLCHGLRSTAGQIGALRLQALAETAELAAHRGAHPEALAAVEALPGEFARCHAWYTEHGLLTPE